MFVFVWLLDDDLFVRTYVWFNCSVNSFLSVFSSCVKPSFECLCGTSPFWTCDRTSQGHLVLCLCPCIAAFGFYLLNLKCVLKGNFIFMILSVQGFACTVTMFYN